MTIAPSAARVYSISNELLMSTTRPACEPSRQPMTIVPLPSAELTLMRVWWSLMLIRTSCCVLVLLLQCEVFRRE